MEDRMLRQACIVLAISGLVLGLSERHGQAGWSDARSNLTLGAASPVISIKNQKNDDDDDDHHHKNKNSDDDSGLTDCTIQQSGGGGGCTAPLKYVCEKLKGGKKCCGCVVDNSNHKGDDDSKESGAGTSKTSGADPLVNNCIKTYCASLCAADPGGEDSKTKCREVLCPANCAKNPNGRGFP
jgi:hypothetical protein